jgi:hypothetical protein
MSSNSGEIKQKIEWRLIGHSYQIADTGDYDGNWEITNGEVSIFTKYDCEEEELQPVVDALNECAAKFYIDDSYKTMYELEKEENRRLYIALQAEHITSNSPQSSNNLKQEEV